MQIDKVFIKEFLELITKSVENNYLLIEDNLNNLIAYFNSQQLYEISYYLSWLKAHYNPINQKDVFVSQDYLDVKTVLKNLQLHNKLK